jgi:hypothetical protein
MKNNKFYTVRTDPTFNQIIVEKGKFNPTNAHIQDRSLDLLSTRSSKMWQGGTTNAHIHHRSLDWLSTGSSKMWQGGTTNAHIHHRSLDWFSTGTSKMWQGGTTNAHIHHRSLDWLSTGTSKMWQGGTSFLGIKIIFCTHMYLFDDINSYMTNFQLSLKL